MEKTILALQQVKVLTGRICDGAIKAASAMEQIYSGRETPWEADYTPFDFCLDMDALRETVLCHSNRFIDVARWSTAHDFMPLDEIAAIKHEEEGLPKHRQSSTLYILAIEMRNPWVIVDDATMDIEQLMPPHATQFLSKLLFRWDTGSRSTRLMLDSFLSPVRKSIDEILTLTDYPFTAFTLGLESTLKSP